MAKRTGKNDNLRKWLIRIAIAVVAIGGIMFLIHTIIQAHQ